MADWAVTIDRFRAQNTSWVYGRSVGCTTETNFKLVDCLRRRESWEELANAQTVVSIHGESFIFGREF